MYNSTPFGGLGNTTPPESEVWFDNLFTREFKQSINMIKKTNSSLFNLSVLELTMAEIGNELLFFCDVKGIAEESLFHEIETAPAFVTSRKEITGQGGYSFSNKSQTLRPPQGYRTVAISRIIRVPNGYKSPDDSIRYAGLEKLPNGSIVQYFWVSEHRIFRKSTYVVTVSAKRVANHLGGRQILLTNGHNLEVVIQERSKMRNTETKNIHFIDSSIDKCRGCILQVHEYLVYKGFAFNHALYNVKSDAGGLVVEYNLTYKDLEPTMDIDDDIISLSLADE